MSYLLEIFAKGLEANVAETLARYFHVGGTEPLAELERQCGQHPDWPDLRCRTGLAYLRGLQFPDAIRHLREACRHKPDYLAARLALAATYDQTGESDKALAELRIANDTHTGSPLVLFCMGYCLEKLARSPEARECYLDVQRIAGDFAPARHRLAAIALLRDDAAEAVRQYQALHSADPADTRVLATLAHLYHRCGRYDEAIDAFETVIAMEPDNWALMDDEVEALVAAGQVREAVERLYRLIEIQGDFADLHLRLADLLSGMGEEDQATRHYLAALQADPDYLEARIRLGTHYLTAGRWEEAAETFHEAAEANDRLLACYVGLGVAQSAAGRNGQAVGTFELAAAVEPNSTLLLSEMARLQLKAAVAREFQENFQFQQELPLAEPELDNDDLLHVQLDRHRQQVEKSPEYADLRYRYGVLLRAEGRLGEAAQQFAEAVRINPAYVPAVIRLGITQQELGRLDEAVETFRRALELQPRYVDLHYRLAVLHTDGKQFAEAVADMERAADLAPGNADIRAALALALQNMGLLDRAAATWRSLAQMHLEAARESGANPAQRTTQRDRETEKEE